MRNGKPMCTDNCNKYTPVACLPNNVNNKFHCSGKILGFVKYQSPGYSTFKLTKEKDLSTQECIDGEVLDNSFYVVLECNATMINVEEMEGTFATKFQLSHNGASQFTFIQTHSMMCISYIHTIYIHIYIYILYI